MILYVIQPWQQDPRRKYEHAGQTPSQHTTLAEAYAALDAIYEGLHMRRLPLDTLEIYVVSVDNRLVPRPGTH